MPKIQETAPAKGNNCHIILASIELSFGGNAGTVPSTLH